MQPSLQILTNEKGKKTFILMPFHEWNSFYQKHKEMENKILYLQELEESVEEMKLISKGKKKAKPFSDLLNEL
ncbi:MAG: hypothetical protein KGZ58_00750 [Ignavibacteriales bacterium]|nr:hypothetical protein [Ignavibacteriales bacterium]